MEPSAEEAMMRYILAALVVVLAFTAAAPAATLDADGVRADAETSVVPGPRAPGPIAPVALPQLPEPELPAPDLAPAAPDPFAGLSSVDDIPLAPLALDDVATDRKDPLVPDAWADALAEVPPAAPAVVATAGGLALLHAFGALRVLGVGVFALYTRLTRSELLDNHHRDAVFQLVKAEPGIALGEVAQRVGLGWGTAVYHLDRLERAGFIASERSGPRRCFFPVGTLPRESRRGIGALKAGTTRSIATFLMQRPGSTQGELANALGMSASAASKQVSKLEEAGLVRRERDWKTVRLHPTPGLSELLQPVPA